METIIKYAFESGALNNIILSVMLIWAMWFVARHWWPNKVESMKAEQQIRKFLKEKEIDADTEIRKLEIEGQIGVYHQVIKDLDKINVSISALNATFNDFLQNILSQFIEDRRDLIDTGIFKSKDRRP